ncbi:hypothetical protein DRP53_01975 [candidate division WOR-3 bacterium]|uniref:Secretion system C-terminal sorting domain-containing protein n=1 Tax=candidate division WOR-3 bacterium TaxID=2052148 RepID=A0A660SKR0_UNCW3|nr:MAG: hypothetical protein DRP53_01975 [candidate division WOR-3 bacterium]
MDGREVATISKERLSGSGCISYDLSHFSSGIYFLIVKTERGVTHHKFILIH